MCSTGSRTFVVLDKARGGECGVKRLLCSEIFINTSQGIPIGRFSRTRITNIPIEAVHGNGRHTTLGNSRTLL
jgi:hypothetical protein